MANWLLPEYIQDMLPDEAWAVEKMRVSFLELMRRSGYQLVGTPMLEYAESLLIHQNHEMDLRTFKLVDQLSGRTMALRADITPQVARVDAHLLNRQGVTRLCYAGSVLHTQPAGATSSRELLQIGAELYGHAGLESDLEVQQLLLQALAQLGVKQVHFDIGHVGIFRALVKRGGISAELEEQLFTVLQGKDNATLQQLVQGLTPEIQQALQQLPTLYGNPEQVIARARQVLPAWPEVTAALDTLTQAAQHLMGLTASLSVDLGDLRGYHYHTGVVFAAYHQGCHDAIALGGRYDELGQSFGRARPATGFSMDLRQIYRLLPKAASQLGICAPALNDAALAAKIAELRAAGEMVVIDLLGDASLRAELQCDRQLVNTNGSWQLVPL